MSIENLKSLKDVRCHDNGSWINNGVRKIYLCIDHHTNPKKFNITVIKRGGKASSVPRWCLSHTYFFYKDYKDFLKIIVSLQSTFKLT